MKLKVQGVEVSDKKRVWKAVRLEGWERAGLHSDTDKRRPTLTSPLAVLETGTLQ